MALPASHLLFARPYPSYHSSIASSVSNGACVVVGFSGYDFGGAEPKPACHVSASIGNFG